MQNFSKKNREKMEEIYLVAESAGLIRESLEYEEKFSDKQPYWKDPVSGRRFRLLENEEFEVSTNDFDRWANSFLVSVPLPKTLEKFSSLIDDLRIIKQTSDSTKDYQRKSRNIRSN